MEQYLSLDALAERRLRRIAELGNPLLESLQCPLLLIFSASFLCLISSMSVIAMWRCLTVTAFHLCVRQ